MMHRNDICRITFLFGWNIFTFQTAESLFQNHLGKKTFHFLSFPFLLACWDRYYGTLSGPELFPLLPKGSGFFRLQDRASMLLASLSGQPRSAWSTRFWPLALSRAGFNPNIPMWGIEVAYNETLTNETYVGYGYKVFFSSLMSQTVM